MGLLLGALLGALLLAPKARAPLLAKISETGALPPPTPSARPAAVAASWPSIPFGAPAEAAKHSLQESYDKLKQDSDAIKKELDGIKASQEARTKEVEALTQQLKECQDKSGSDLKQKVCTRSLACAALLHICARAASSHLHRVFVVASAQVADAQAKLDEAQKHLADISA